MIRERLLWIVAALGLLAGGWWLQANTEWVDEDRPRPARGEARENPVYAAVQLLRKLGMQVRHVQALDALPPEGARLVLLSSDWELLPGRVQALQAWVRRGGHLVLLQGSRWDETPLGNWAPIYWTEAKPAVSGKPANIQPAVADASDAGHSELTSCDFFMLNQRLVLKPRQLATWSLDGTRGAQALRVAVGAGSVTVLNTQPAALYNKTVLLCDNPVFLARAVQAAPGDTAWIYLSETREALLPWLWNQGWIALLALALALAAALWRGSIRFGPRMAPAPRLRRSIAEQVRGLGAWLHREGRESLLAAQQRALDETAARRLPDYRRLVAAARPGAIAAATGLDAEALATAFHARNCTRAQLAARLHTLEAARRALLGLSSSDERRLRTTPP